MDGWKASSDDLMIATDIIITDARRGGKHVV
jgi:hypothetical protein